MLLLRIVLVIYSWIDLIVCFGIGVCVIVVIDRLVSIMCVLFLFIDVLFYGINM